MASYKVTNKGSRRIAAILPGGPVVIKPGKSETFDQAPTNLEALVKVGALPESAIKQAEEDRERATADASAATDAAAAAPSAPASAPKAPAATQTPTAAPKPAGGPPTGGKA